jgi:NADH:ubiquinone oxidoreductase subunit 4 (subunit M)
MIRVIKILNSLHIESPRLAHLQPRIDIIYIAFLTSMNNIKKIIGLSSVAGIFLIALALSILFATTTNSVVAQNLTTNVSNAIRNVSAPQPANQTAERGENVSIGFIRMEYSDWALFF